MGSQSESVWWEAAESVVFHLSFSFCGASSLLGEPAEVVAGQGEAAEVVLGKAWGKGKLQSLC